MPASKPPCKECQAVKTCIHDDRCNHGILTNREPCPDGCVGAELTEQQERELVYAAELNKFRSNNNLPPLPLPTPYDKRPQRNFKLSEKAYNGLLVLAYDLGYVHDSSRKPNPTQFLEALGQNLLHVFYD